MHRCPNRACPSRGLETLINWVSAAMDIEGVGEQFVRRLWDEGLLRSMPDLYRLTAPQLLEIEGYGEISAARAVEAIERSKEQPFSRVLFGLNIPNVGWVPAQNLARHFGTVDRLIAASQEDGARPGRADRRVVRRRGEPRARRRPAVARVADGRGRGRAAGRRLPQRAHVRRHRNARALQPRGGEERHSRRLVRRSDSVSRKTTGVIVGEQPGLEGGQGGEGRRPASDRERPAGAARAVAGAFSRPPGLSGQDRRKAVLRALGRQGRDGVSVHDEREGKPCPRVAGQGGGIVGGARLGANCPPGGRCPCGGRACRSAPRPRARGRRRMQLCILPAAGESSRLPSA